MPLDFDPCLKYGGVGAQIDIKQPFLVVMQHPVTTEYNQSKQQAEILLKVIENIGLPVFWFWPNPDAGSDGTSSAIRTYREEHPNANIRFFKNLEGLDFLKLLKQSKCLIGNSSVGIRESAYLGVPVVNIGSRQNKRLRGSNVIDVEFETAAIENAIQQQITHGIYPSENIYGNGDAGQLIASVLAKAEVNIKKVINY
jgi:UDP-hydrolysing UDP-N-acetyl-D-glucosamine 2-epimerase